MVINPQKKPDNQKDPAHLRGILLKVGTELFAGVLVGVAIGVYCDNYFGTKPLCIIIFFLLGCAAGFLNVFNLVKKIS